MPCHHEPVTDAARLRAAFGVHLVVDDASAQGDQAEAMAPFIIQAERPSSDALGDIHLGLFGLLPAAVQNAGAAAQTGHCRVETMKSNPSFRHSWWSGQRCVVPVERLTEWCYASGRPQLWHIARADEQPMGLAGLWNAWTSPTGDRQLSFCLLTLNADGHAVFDRLGHPTHEKRMPVILPPEAQRQWLHGTGVQVERLLARFPAEQLQALPLEPTSWPARREGPDMFAQEWWGLMYKAPRRKRVTVRREAPDTPVPVTGDLFA